MSDNNGMNVVDNTSADLCKKGRSVSMSGMVQLILFFYFYFFIKFFKLSNYCSFYLFKFLIKILKIMM